MTLCYIHRPGSYSAIIREASSCRRWELWCTVRNLGTLNSKWDAFIKLLPSGFRESCERGGRKSVRVRGDGGHHENKALCINMSRAPMLSQRPSSRPCMGLFMNFTTSSSVFLWDSYVCKGAVLWFLDLLFGSFLSIGFVQLQCSAWVLASVRRGIQLPGAHAISALSIPAHRRQRQVLATSLTSCLPSYADILSARVLMVPQGCKKNRTSPPTPARNSSYVGKGVLI